MSRIQNFFISIILLPLLILKQIGELFIATFIYFFESLHATYKLIIYIIFWTLNYPGKIISLILKKFKRKYFKKETPKFTIAQKRRKRIFKKKLKLLFFEAKYFLLGFLFLLLIFIYIEINTFISDLPNPQQIITQGFPATTKIFDRNGILLYEIYENYNRIPIRLTDIPKHVIHATLAAEDKEFYLHNGISLRGITRAILHNLSNNELEGGSTITQQLIRSTYLTLEKSYVRKFKEIILSILLEKYYSKDLILEMYLNQVPYGGTAWGIETASKTYFNKQTSELTIAEAAFLAGLPASPSKYSPFNNNENNYKARQEEILKRMLSEKFITKEEFDTAKSAQLSFPEMRVPIAAPHFVMYVKELLNKYYGVRLTETGGLRVTTTLDLTLQEEIQKIVSDEIDKLKPLQVTNGSALVTNPKNGQIIAMIGSTDYFDKNNDGNVNITQTLQQPGSSIKVVTYAAAIQNGYTAASIINDSPVTYSDGQSVYKPVNYDGKYHGSITLRTALGSSYNIPAVKILNSIGLPKMIETGKNMGIDSWENEENFGLSLTLGGGAVTMTDLSEVYGTLANGGIRNNLTPFIKVTDYNGKNLPIPNHRKPYQAIPESVAFIISDILSDNDARTPAFGRNSALNISGKKVAVKTGTSDEKRDNWTIGYTSDILVSTWVGNNDNRPMDPRLTSGVTGASTIWRSIMDLVLKDKTNIQTEIPPGITAVKCNSKYEYFIEGTITNNPCPKSIPSPSVSPPAN